MKRFLICAGVLILFLGISLVIILVSLGHDLPPQDYPELALTYESVPEEENAYPLFLKAFELSTLEEQNDLIQSYWERGENAEAFAELMAENESMITLLKQGVKKESCQPPEITSYADLMPYSHEWLSMGKFLVGSSKWLREEGQWEEAVDRALLAASFGNLIMQAPESLIQYLVGVAQVNLAMTELRELSFQEQCRSEDLLRIAEALENLTAPEQAGIVAMKQEFKVIQHTLGDFEKEQMTWGFIESLNSSASSSLVSKIKIPGYFFRPNQTEQIFAAFFTIGIENFAKPYAERKEDGLDNLLKGSRGVKRLLQPNALGDLLVMILCPSFESIVKTTYKVSAEIRATQVLVALQLSRREQGSLPEKLELLVPVYLDTVPVDPFDGQPFRYDVERGILYSVGVNGVDDGGAELLLEEGEENRGYRKRWNGEDAVFGVE
ncbi:hypothetical protein P3T73_02440 [Kiritimatiellota bacterium B12222]|nr:hypothetical protein P3T73_02440 [Kiritimatiellota bacterium B12222]